jgi:hypothetical protein
MTHSRGKYIIDRRLPLQNTSNLSIILCSSRQTITATKLPVGLPLPNPTKAYWQTPLHPVADNQSTPNLPKNTKYAIIGSGITGTITAWKIPQEEPSASIVILEAQ